MPLCKGVSFAVKQKKSQTSHWKKVNALNGRKTRLELPEPLLVNTVTLTLSLIQVVKPSWSIKKVKDNQKYGILTLIRLDISATTKRYLQISEKKPTNLSWFEEISSDQNQLKTLYNPSRMARN